jgi:hypothetical protein
LRELLKERVESEDLEKLKEFWKEALKIFNTFRQEFRERLKNYENRLTQFVVEFNKILFILMFKINCELLIDKYLLEKESDDIDFFEDCLREINPVLNSELSCYLGYKIEQELDNFDFGEDDENENDSENEEN